MRSLSSPSSPPTESDDLLSFLQRVDEGLPMWYGHASLFVAAVAFGLMVAYTAVSQKTASTTVIYIFLILVNANVGWLLLRRFYKRYMPSEPLPSSSEAMLHNYVAHDEKITENSAATSAVQKQPVTIYTQSLQAEEEASKKKLASQLINASILTLLASTGIWFKVMAGPVTVYFAHFDWPLDLFCVSTGLMWAVLLLVMCRCVPKASSNNINLYIAALYTALFCFPVCGFFVLQRHQLQSMEPLRLVAGSSDDSQYYSGSDFYTGEAYVRGVELTYNETGFCEYKPGKRSIPVQLDVYFDGSWACPSTNSDLSCQVTIDAEVPCTFWDSWFNERLGRAVCDDDLAALEEIATPQDYLEYTVFRYHSSGKYYGDDDNPCGFDDDTFFDPYRAPSASMWNHPSETIVGNCNTCKAMTMSNFFEYAREVHSLTMYMYTLVGAAVAVVIIGGILDLIVFSQRKNSTDANGLITWV